MSDSNDEGHGIKISKTAPKLTAPGYKIQLSTNQAVAIAEFVDSPVFKILEDVYVAQRKDHLARTALSGAIDLETLFYYKGSANELRSFFKNMRDIKKAINEDPDKE